MKLLFAGDYYPNERITALFSKGELESAFSEVKRINETVDYAIVNFECTVAYDTDKPIQKSGPCLKTKEIGVEALKLAGFNLLCLANNHFRDYGSSAVEKTIRAIEKNNLDFVGGGNDIQEASAVFYKEIDKKNVAFINVCENEFSIASEKRGGSNPLNPISQYYQIKEARKKADYVFLIIHGGHEYCQEPSLRMKQVYRFFIDAGADAIINHHQHCYCSYEVYNGKPIFYGLGNFCFDRLNDTLPETWNYGYIVVLSIEGESLNFSVIPYEQCLNNHIVHFIEDKTEFEENIKYLNHILIDENSHTEYLHDFYKSQPVIGITVPYLGGHWWRLRKYVKNHIHPMWYYDFRDFVLCESHHERLSYELENIIDNQ